MMPNEDFFSEDNQNLIQELSLISIDKAILKLKSQKNIFSEQIIQQLTAKEKIKDKLPTWLATKNILFPPNLNLEQSSSEITADFKSKITTNQLLIDLTGGFGIDSYYFSKTYKSVYYVEKNENLFEIVKHNFKKLLQENITLINQDCITFLENFKTKLLQKEIVFYIDPARRDASNNKMVIFSETEPNILQLLPKLLTYANTVLLKASPMLDIDLAIKELQNITDIFVVSVKNECKELLFLIQKENQKAIKIHTINISKNKTEILTFEKKQELESQISYQTPLKYLYEPNASILKSGAFKWVGLTNNCFKIAPNTHLYTSETANLDFQGKIFEIVETINITEIKSYLKSNQINVICRNYPLTPQEIKKKYKIIDGGDLYLICFKDYKHKPLTILAKRKEIN